MSFFNKKEDVLQIELTPYGRELLMKGQLRPSQYAFFDDDILYDSQFGGVSENNTQTKVRILTDTPSLKPQKSLQGVESNYYSNKITELDNILVTPIGTNKLSSKKANGWEVTALLGEFTSSLSHVSSSANNKFISPLHRIPQIECELNFTMSVGGIHDDPIEDYVDNEDYQLSEQAEDGTFLIVSTEQLLLNISEKNGFSYRDSLALESFIFSHLEDESYRLKFLAPDNISTDDLIDDNIADELLEQEDFEIGSYQGEGNGFDDTTVENYFFINTDDFIPEFELCKGVTKLKEKNIYLRLGLDCEEDDNIDVNIYRTLVTDQDIEDCEV